MMKLKFLAAMSAAIAIAALTATGVTSGDASTGDASPIYVVNCLKTTAYGR